MSTDSQRWQKGVRLGRWQLRLILLRHRYANASDRWVLQTSTVYDRKRAVR